jgi:hypothetical protein
VGRSQGHRSAQAVHAETKGGSMLLRIPQCAKLRLSCSHVVHDPQQPIAEPERTRPLPTICLHTSCTRKGDVCLSLPPVIAAQGAGWCHARQQQHSSHWAECVCGWQRDRAGPHPDKSE